MDMKNAVGYIWVGDANDEKEIKSQEYEIAMFCRIHDIHLMATYKDAGKNNRDFRGESWKALEDYLFLYGHKIDCILVTNPDRLSRNIGLLVKQETLLRDLYNVSLEIAITNRIEPTLILQSFPLN